MLLHLKLRQTLITISCKKKKILPTLFMQICTSIQVSQNNLLSCLSFLSLQFNFKIFLLYTTNKHIHNTLNLI